MNGRGVIEDVQKFIEGQLNNQDPIVLCGEENRVKTFLLERLAYKAVRGSRPRFKVVLYLKDSHTRSSLTKDTKNAETNTLSKMNKVKMKIEHFKQRMIKW